MGSCRGVEEADVRQFVRESSFEIARRGLIRAPEQVSPAAEGVFQQPPVRILGPVLGAFLTTEGSDVRHEQGT